MNKLDTPGVYIHHIDISERKVLPFGVAGLVGIAQKGPVDNPQLLTKWDEFVNVFGDFLPYSYLAYAVHGFFVNNGRQCYVTRVASPTAKTSSTKLGKFGNHTIRVSAIDVGSWGDDIYADVKDSLSETMFLAQLKSVARKGNKQASADATVDLQPGMMIMLVAQADAAMSQELTIDCIQNSRIFFIEELQFNFPRGSYIYGKGFRLEVQYGTQEEIFDELSLNPQHPRYFQSVINGPTTVIQYLNKAIQGFSTLIHVDWIEEENEILEKGIEDDEEKAVLMKKYTSRANQNFADNAVESLMLEKSSYKITQQSLMCLKSEDIPDDVIQKLEEIKDQLFIKKEVFLYALENSIGEEKLDLYKSVILRCSRLKPRKLSGGSDGAHTASFLLNIDDQPGLLFEAREEGRGGNGIKLTVAPTTSLLAYPVKRGDKELFLKHDIDLEIGDTITIKYEEQGFSSRVVSIVRKQLPDRLISESRICQLFPAGSQVIQGEIQTRLIADVDLGASELLVESAGNFIINKDAVIIHAKPSHVRSKFKICGKSSKQFLQQIELEDEIPFDCPQNSLIETDGFSVAVEKGMTREFYSNLTIDENNNRHYFEFRINPYSKLIRCKKIGNPAPTSPIASITTNLSGGMDPSEIDLRFLTGYHTNGNGLESSATNNNASQSLQGLASFEEVGDVDVVCIPDLHYALDNGRPHSPEVLRQGQEAMLQHCAKIGYRFAILEPSFNSDLTSVKNWPSHFAFLATNQFGAIYYPWIQVQPLEEGGQIRWVPPCGHISGIFSRTDIEQGVAQAPANTHVYGLFRLKHPVSDSDHALLNHLGVNCIRSFAGRGTLLWGARTLSKESKWRYVNTRRIYMALIKMIYYHLQWIVFEPNTPDLWGKITDSLNSFLEAYFLKGFLKGMSHEQAYFVQCDNETNPPEMREKGELVVKMGIALIAPAEFIIITIRRRLGSISVEGI